MTFYWILVIFIISFILIAKSGAMLVDSLTQLARFLGISEYVIAFILMSVVTSIPELFIGISSTFQGVPTLAFGSIIGANIVNLTLVIGVVAVFAREIKVEGKISRRNFWLISFLAFLPIFLITDGVLSRGDGFVLLFSFVLYIGRLLGERSYFSKVVNELNFSGESGVHIFRTLKKFLIGVGMLFLGALILVWAGKSLADSLSMGLVLFGIVFIALGTALPELAFGIRASLMNHPGMTLGNSLGSIAFNSVFIIGLMAVIRPIVFTPNIGILIAIFFLFIAFLVFNIFAYSRSLISRGEGFALILLYILFLSVQYMA